MSKGICGDCEDHGFYAPTIFSGGHIVSQLSIRMSSTKNGYRSLSFEKSSVLDSYFIHRYIIIKRRSNSI